MLLDLLRDIHMCRIVFADDQCTGRVHIDSVYDSRTDLSVDSGETVCTMIHNGIYQRTTIMSGRRVNHHSLRFVNDQYVRILIQNVQRNVLRFDFYRLWCRNGCTYLVSTFYNKTGFYHRLSIYFNFSALYQLLQETSGLIRINLCQKFIQPHSGLAFLHGIFF